MGFFKVLGKALTSKTMWGVAGLTAVNTLPQIAQFIPPGTPAALGVNIALAGLAAYGRITAKGPLTNQGPKPAQPPAK